MNRENSAVVSPFSQDENVLSSEPNEIIKKMEACASDMFKPILHVLKICGSYSDKKPVLYGYCLCIQTIVIFIAVRYLLVFRNDTIGYNIVGIVVLIWYYFILVICSVGYCVLNNKYLHIFCSAVDKYDQKYKMHVDIHKKKKLHTKLIIGAFMLASVYSVSSNIMFSIDDDRHRLLLATHLTPFEASTGNTFIALIIVFTCMEVLCLTIIYSNIVFLVTNISILKQEFNNINESIKKNISNNEIENLENLRLQHEALISVLNDGNKIFRYVAFTAYLFGLPILCGALYGATSGRLAIADVSGMILVLICAVVAMSLATFMGAVLNEAAHSPLEEILKINTSTISNRTILQMQLFISRLTAYPIGVDVIGLFVIDNNTILMIFGTVISYALLVVQFSTLELSQCSTTNATTA